MAVALRRSAFVLLALLGVSAVTADPYPFVTPGEPGCRTMMDAMKTLDFLSIFTTSVEKSGLTRAFSGSNSKSVVLVPTDGAFEAAADRLGIETSSFFNNTLALRRLVQNHVIPGEVDYQSPTKKIYSSMDFGSMLTIYSRNGEMYVETENATVVAKGTEILHQLCDDSKIFVISQVLIPTEIDSAEMFRAPPPLRPSTPEVTPPSFFSRMFPGFGGPSSEAASRSAFPRAMFPGMGGASPSAATYPSGGFFSGFSAPGTASSAPSSGAAAALPATYFSASDPASGFGPGFMSGMASGAAEVPTAPGFPSVASAFPSAAGDAPLRPAAAFPSTGSFPSYASTTGGASGTTGAAFPSAASFTGFSAPGSGTASSGLPGFGGAASGLPGFGSGLSTIFGTAPSAAAGSTSPEA